MTVVVDPERGGQEKIVLEKEKTEASRNSINQKKIELKRVLELNGSVNSAEHRFTKVVPRGDNNLREIKISRKKFGKWNDDAEIERQNYRHDESNHGCIESINIFTASQNLCGTAPNKVHPINLITRCTWLYTLGYREYVFK